MNHNVGTRHGMQRIKHTIITPRICSLFTIKKKKSVTLKRKRKSKIQEKRNNAEVREEAKRTRK